MATLVRPQTAPSHRSVERDSLRASCPSSRALFLPTRRSASSSLHPKGHPNHGGGGGPEAKKEDEADLAARRRAQRSREQEWDYVRKVTSLPSHPLSSPLLVSK